MSDYLWDKTGEPEEDVAQLENLLGALKYQPRPLEIPATAAMPTTAVITATAASRTRPTTIFSRPRLAIAASLLLTLLAGAWLVTRQGEPQKNQLAKVERGESPAAVSEKPDEAVVTPAGTDKHETPGDNEQRGPREDKAVVVAAAAAKPRRTASRPSVAKRHRLLPAVKENAPAPPEEVAAQPAMRWQVEQPLTP
ncbi:MAG TPA: hypothetical protein VGA87_03930, partial [Pyrinomonadaceae bacterium]